MDVKFCAFDLETAKVLPHDADLEANHPLGITCAGTLLQPTDDRVVLWHGELNEEGVFPAQMTPEEVEKLVHFLQGLHKQGWPIVTWNGLGFDFRCLAEEAPPALRPAIVDLALSHIDLMFQLFCDRGFTKSIQVVAEGMGVAGKAEGMHGALAPLMWTRGRSNQQLVLEYLGQDVRLTAELYLGVTVAGELRWRTNKGTWATWPCSEPLTVEEALTLPLPDTSWMQNPWPREKFTAWMEE